MNPVLSYELNKTKTSSICFSDMVGRKKGFAIHNIGSYTCLCVSQSFFFFLLCLYLNEVTLRMNLYGEV